MRTMHTTLASYNGVGRWVRLLALTVMLGVFVSGARLDAHACGVYNYPSGCGEGHADCDEICVEAYGLVDPSHDCYHHFDGKEIGATWQWCGLFEVEWLMDCDCESNES
jgi:hypothetical protein